MKTKILIAAVMLFALAVAAQAQTPVTSFQVSSIPVTTVASCGASELTGDVLFTAISGVTTAGTGSITITYPTGVNIAAGSIIQVSVNGGAPIGSANITTPGNANLLQITIPAGVGSGAGGAVQSPDVIRVTGVRVNVAGTGLTSVAVNVSGTNFAFVGGQTNLTVISSVQPTFKAFATGGSSITTVANVAAFTGTVTSGTNPVVVGIKENYITAFNPGINGQIAQLTFSAIPVGLTLSVPATTTDNAGETWTLVSLTGSGATFGVSAVGGTGTVLNSSSTSLSVFYELTTSAFIAASSNTLDTLNIPVTIGTTTPVTLPLPLGTVTVTAQLAPLTAALMTWVPRYGSDQCLIGPANVVSIVSARTVLMTPYALFSASPPYNTGIAIANTTTDPGVTAMGFGTGQTATPQNGAIKFYFFPQNGITGPNAFSTSTTPSSTPGGGFTAATGLIASGSTYVVNLSELLNAAGFTGTFWQGYIIAVCDFTNGHGQYFIGNAGAASGVFEQGALMLVVDPAQRTAASSPEKLEN